MVPYYQRWENPDKKRYYEILVRRDLWSQWVLTRVWGGIGSRLGRESDQVFKDTALLEQELMVIATRRAKHGYDLIREGGQKY